MYFICIQICRYAFVQYGSYFAAKNALEAVNMMEIKGRPVAVDWVVPKDQYEQSVQQGEMEERRKGREDGESDGESDVESHGSDIESHENDVESNNNDVESHDSDVESDAESHDRDAESHDSAEADSLKRDVTEGKTLFIR